MILNVGMVEDIPTKYDTLWCKGFKEIQVLEAFFNIWPS